MASNPHVLGLLEEMLDSGKTPEEVCRACPDLLPEVRQRWQEFQLIDAQVRTLIPGLGTPPDAGVTAPLATGLPQVPGYEVEAVLGRGGMGVVYKARHVALKRTVALKMLAAGHADPAERARFRAEAEAVARLQHPNIVQIYEIGEAAGRPFFALEYVAGGSLAERLVGQPLPPRDAARLVAALAEAMHLAHSRNLVHRDLKPANVLLAAKSNAPVGQCQPKVTDFGLVRQLDADSGQTFHGMLMGTPSYMAPEQAEGRARCAGPAADVYALGAILYECLTGRPPFDGATPLETLEQVRSREPAAPSSLNRQAPRDLETICLKCLRKEPERRYASAQELADDLGRFVCGEPVAARPVGRLERAAKWMRRNPTVACLSAVAALALVAGTVVSLLFGVEARRQEGLATDRAGDLERQAIELKAQTRAATENAQRAKKQEEEVRRVLIASLMIPIEGNAHKLNSPLDNTEVVGLCQLRKVPREVRLQFLDTALADPETARRVGRRADWVIQAIVGCNRALRDEVGQLLIQRIQKPETSQEVVLACAQLGQAANLDDRVWAERSADALSAALCDNGIERVDCPALAKSLAAVLEHLPRAQAAEHAARVTDVFLTRWQAPGGLYLVHDYYGPVLVVMSRHLDAATANRAADRIEAIHRLSAELPLTWVSLAKAQVAVCQHLPPSDSAAHVKRMVDLVLATKEEDKFRYTYHTATLATMSGQLDAKVAARVADEIIGILGDSYTTLTMRSEFVKIPSLAEDLARVAERLDAPGSLRAAEALISVLKKADNLTNIEPLRKALAGMCRRLDADGAKRVAEAIALAVQDPKTPILARALLAHGFAVVTDKLDPDKAALLERAIVDVFVVNLADAKNLADVKSMLARMQLWQALAAVCGRPGTKSATRAAEALTAAILDPQTPFVVLKPLAEALTVVSGQLPPAQASLRASKAAKVLDSLWIAKTNRLERASLAQAMAGLWTHLSPLERAPLAKRMADYLGAALQDAKTERHEFKSLTEALTAVCRQLDPAEREARLGSAVDIVYARFRESKNADQTSSILTGPLFTLWLHLDRNGLARVADTLFSDLGEPIGQRYWLEYKEHLYLFKEVAARMEESDLERLLEPPLTASVQRAVLDVLGDSKNRYFRNTWDYLDWTRSKAK
jgi:hypothetical protein